MKAVFFISLFLISFSLSAQNDNETVGLTLSEIALISLQPNDEAVMMNIQVQEEAGLLQITSNQDNTKYLNYTAAVAANGSGKAIYVDINSGSLPPGINLSVTASSYQGTGGGTFGYTLGEVLLDGSGSEKLIGGIGGSYTGVGAGNGHQLTYKITGTEPQNAGQWDGNSSLLITYTLADD